MPTATECIMGTCTCEDAEQCAFTRCGNCDWPVDAAGHTLVDHGCADHEVCAACGGPATNKVNRIYGARG